VDLSWYYVKGILMLAGISMVPVLGLVLLTGFTGLFSFGNAAFMSIGGYTTAFMMVTLKMPFIPSLLMGGAVASLGAVVIGKFTLKLKGDYFCIATLGFGEAFRLILDNFEPFGGARGWAGLPLKTDLITVIIVDIIAVIIMANIVRSRHGRNMIAVREEELASQVIGINVFKTKMTSFVISAFYGGIGGGLLASYLGFVQPKMFALTKSTELTIIVIFGGLGSITGGVLGSLVLVILPELLRSFANWRLVVYGAVVVFIMIARPEGLIGGKEITFKGMYNLFNKIIGKNKKDLKPTKREANINGTS
jgi:branched-chain amino acid transport system permease protein